MTQTKSSNSSNTEATDTEHRKVPSTRRCTITNLEPSNTQQKGGLACLEVKMMIGEDSSPSSMHKEDTNSPSEGSIAQGRWGRMSDEEVTCSQRVSLEKSSQSWRGYPILDRLPHRLSRGGSGRTLVATTPSPPLLSHRGTLPGQCPLMAGGGGTHTTNPGFHSRSSLPDSPNDRGSSLPPMTGALRPLSMLRLRSGLVDPYMTLDYL